jgi:antitoxin VapB
MTILIKNPETDALARKVAKLKGVGLTQAVHAALERELDAIDARPSFVERGLAFAERLRKQGNPELGLPVDKAFIDSLYED